MICCLFILVGSSPAYYKLIHDICISTTQRLHVNDRKYHVQPPTRAQPTLEELGKMHDIQLLVAQVKYISRQMTFPGN